MAKHQHQQQEVLAEVVVRGAATTAPPPEAPAATPFGPRDVLVPLLAPLLLAYWLLSVWLAFSLTLLVFPSLFLAARLRAAVPILAHVWRARAAASGRGVALVERLLFEGSHCVHVVARLITLPMRRHLPDFYVLGAPKCGTTTLAALLRAHPAVSGLDGVGAGESGAVSTKESHFLTGALGRGAWAAGAPALYRSFFPTLLRDWWVERVVLRRGRGGGGGNGRHLVFDATPTYVCLPFVARRVKRLTPDARLVVLVRDPVDAVWSAETMLRNLGVPLNWSLADPLPPAEQGGAAADPRFAQLLSDDDAAFWARLEALRVDEPLPADLPRRFMFDLSSHLMAARYADRLRPWVSEFGAERLLIVTNAELAADTEGTVRRVLAYVGADAEHPGFCLANERGSKGDGKGGKGDGGKGKGGGGHRLLAGDYRGRRVDPGVRAWLMQHWFADSEAELRQLLAQQAARLAGGAGGGKAV